MNLESFKILKEYDDGYDVGHPGGKKFHVKKHKLSDKSLKLIGKMQKMSDGGKVKGYSDGTDTPVSSQDPMMSQAPQDDQVMSVMPASQAAQLDAENAAPQAPAQTASDLQPAVNAPPSQAVAAPEAPVSYEQAMQNQKAALLDIGKAQADQAQSESGAVSNALKELANVPSQQKIIDSNRDMQNLLENAYANKTIDPDRFIKTHFNSLGSKIVGGIAAFLGGLGSSVTGQPNPFLSMLKYNIDNDINAQKNDQSTAENLFKMNRQVMGDDISATLATQNQIYTAIKYKMLQAASQANSKIAMDRAKMGASNIDAQLQQNSYLQGFVGGSPGPEKNYANQLSYMKLYHPDIAKDAEAKYIPSIGVAKVPVTEDDRTQLNNLDNLNAGLDKAMDLQDTFGKTGAWTPTTRAQAEDIKQNLSLNLNNLYSQKKINDVQMEFYKKALDSIGGINAGGPEESLRGMKAQMEQKQASLLKGLGVKPFEKSPEDQVAIAWAQKNPQDPMSKDILMKNRMWKPSFQPAQPSEQQNYFGKK